MRQINTDGFFMDKNTLIEHLVNQWIKIAERDLLTAKQGLETNEVVTDTVCFHCQQAAEKYLKAFLVQKQIEFSKTHNIMSLLNLCSSVDKSFKENLPEADNLTDYAVEKVVRRCYSHGHGTRPERPDSAWRRFYYCPWWVPQGHCQRFALPGYIISTF